MKVGQRGMRAGSRANPTANTTLTPAPTATPTSKATATSGVIPTGVEGPHSNPSTPSERPMTAPALINAAFARSPRIGAALRHGRLRSWRDGELVLAYPAGDFRLSLLLSEKVEAERLLTEQAGQPIRLSLLEGAASEDAPSQAELEARDESARVDQLRTSALESSAVRDAVRILGGTVDEVRVLSKERPR